MDSSVLIFMFRCIRVGCGSSSPLVEKGEVIRGYETFSLFVNSIRQSGKRLFEPSDFILLAFLRKFWFLDGFTGNLEISQRETESLMADLDIFHMREGRIESDTADQVVVDHFAADFQGLRHFGAKMGAALELGNPWMGAFRETDDTLMFVYPSVGVSPDDPGTGGVVKSRVPLFEMLETLSQEGQE